MSPVISLKECFNYVVIHCARPQIDHFLRATRRRRRAYGMLIGNIEEGVPLTPDCTLCTVRLAVGPDRRRT